MATLKAVKVVPVRKAVEEEQKRAKKLTIEVKAQDECCEPGCGPGTCSS